MPKLVSIIIIALFTGVSSGFLSSAFLYLLKSVTDIRSKFTFLIWYLPIFGTLLGLLIKKIPRHINQGIHYVVSDTEDLNHTVSPWMVPFIFITSLGTHVFGGSAGREGVGVIMGASSAQLLTKLHSSFKDKKHYLIYSGIASGFSSLFGTPLAAIIFVFELQKFKNIRNTSLLICSILSSYIGFFISNTLGPEHEKYKVNFDFDWSILIYVIIAGLISGIAGKIFLWGIKIYSKIISSLFPSIVLKLFMGGLIISVIVHFTKSYSYIGIGIELLSKSFITQMSFYDFFIKLILTILTLSIGFKGGEVTPLFIIGASLSNATLGFLNFKNFTLSSSLGMVSLFGAVSSVPIAASIMGAELFGWKILILCIFTNFLGSKLIGILKHE